jgi:hypothetical protein
MGNSTRNDTQFKSGNGADFASLFGKHPDEQGFCRVGYQKLWQKLISARLRVLFD